MVRATRLVPFLLAAAVALGACGGNDLKTADPPSSSSPTAGSSGSASTSSDPTPTVPADVPLTGKNLKSPDEKPPVMPVAATQHTPEGAVAFAVFFVQTIDWGYATTSPVYMNHYFEQTCVECITTQAFLTTAIHKLGYYRGSRATIRSAQLGAIGGPDTAEYSATMRVDVTAWDVVNDAGISLGTGTFVDDAKREIWVAWRGSEWAVIDMKTQI